MLNFDKILKEVVYGDFWINVEYGDNVHKLEICGINMNIDERRETIKITRPLGLKLVGFIITKKYPVPILSGMGKDLYIGSQKASKEMDKEILKDIYTNITNLKIIQVSSTVIVENILDDIYADAMLNGLDMFDKEKEDEDA